jgi:ribosomal protein L37AE/L43A
MKMNKPLPTLRRTKEQIDKDNAEFSNCGHCGKPLRKSKQRRDSPKTCSQCRYELSSGSSAIRTICKQLQRKKPVIAEDEMMFEDHPNGDSDKEGKVTINPTFVNYGISPLSEVIKTSNYQYKNGSARDGYRYKRSE